MCLCCLPCCTYLLLGCTACFDVLYICVMLNSEMSSNAKKKEENMNYARLF